MHTTSLSGTITAVIYSHIFPQGILERKQLHFVSVSSCAGVCVRVCVGGEGGGVVRCVRVWCVLAMRGNQIRSLQSDRDWIELVVCCYYCCGGQQWIVGDRRWNINSQADCDTCFPEVYLQVQILFLEITASSAECFLLCLSHLLIHISNLLSCYLPAQSKFSFLHRCFFCGGTTEEGFLCVCFLWLP